MSQNLPFVRRGPRIVHDSILLAHPHSTHNRHARGALLVALPLIDVRVAVLLRQSVRIHRFCFVWYVASDRWK